jgi:dihydrofolate synthase/folylpolyglutamate synthase
MTLPVGAAPGSQGRDLAGWLEYLERLHPSAIDLGLDRVARVRAAMGLDPAFPIITVGGTNGKGSTCAYLEAILLHAGYRVALYTSPHLMRYNERVRVDGREVRDADLVAAFERIEAARGATSLTYFEFGTLAAMQIFLAERVDVAILEVGLGGRLDAVNAFDADCAVLISVDLDHMEFLGDSREAIGREKAGIFRAGRPAICADPHCPDSVREHAQATGAIFLEIGRDFSFDADEIQWRFRAADVVRGGLPPPSLRGAHQLANASAALMALETLRPGLPVPMQAIRAGLVEATMPGRFQVLPGRPVTVLDVAHNPHAARALAANLKAHGDFGRTIAVFAMLADKDATGVVDAVRTTVDDWFIAPLAGPRGGDVARLRRTIETLDPVKPVRSFESPCEAYAAARSEVGLDDRIVVFGSFHTVGEVLASLERPAGSSRG